MIRRKTITILAMFFLINSGTAQNVFSDLKGTVKRADDYNSRLSYSKALELYSKALLKKKNQKNVALNKRAAAVYKRMGHYAEAKKCYDNMIASGYIFTSQDSIDFFNTLQSAGYTKMNANIFSGKKLNDLFKDTLYYNITELPFNTDHSEYCPISFRNGLMYVSDEDPSSLVKKYNAINEGGFASMQYIEETDSIWKMPRKVLTDIKALHTGPMAIYNNQKNAILNVCMQDKKKPYRLLLYNTSYDEQTYQWKVLSALPFNNSSYSVAHPSITEDGKTIFFISDKPGGYGGTDIYASYLKDGRWTEPLNLGSKINTKGNEQYPYISQEHILFFSSDGRYGLGGSDIYYTDLYFKDTTVLNMGSPVNSNMDDFGFSYDSLRKTGFFSSNRPAKKKGDNLYSFKENKILMTLTIRDDLDKSKLEHTEIELFDVELGNHVRYKDSLQQINAWLKPAHQYQWVIRKEDYVSDTLYVFTDPSGNFKKIDKEIFLKRKSVYYASVRLYDKEFKQTDDSAYIIVNNISTDKIDTIRHKGTWYKVKLDSESEYIITSRNKDSLRYIYVEKKTLKDLYSKPYYNMYLASPKPTVFHVLLKKCAEGIFKKEDQPKIKIQDKVNGNEFFVSPGPDGDFQFVVTDSRLFNFYLDEEKILFSDKEIISDAYCVSFYQY